MLTFKSGLQVLKLTYKTVLRLPGREEWRYADEMRRGEEGILVRDGYEIRVQKA